MRAPFRSLTWVCTVIALVTLVGLATAGCSDEGEDTTVSESTTSTTTIETTTTTEPATTTTTTEAPAGPTTTLTVDSSEEAMSNGNVKACGIITRVWMDGSTRKLEIDYVDFLTGAAADAAAVADGLISAGEHVDNDYYARNKSTKLRTFTVSGSVYITTYSRVEPIDIADPPYAWADFYDLWNLVGPPEPSDAGLSDGLWWIERDANGVVAIEQQWVP